MFRLSRTLILLSIPVFGAPVYEQMYGGPGPSTSTDAKFVAAGNTAYESFGFEVSFNSNQQARINALKGPNNFTFNVARVASLWEKTCKIGLCAWWRPIRT